MSLRKTEPFLDFGRGVMITTNGRQFTLVYGTKDKRHFSEISSALKVLLQDSIRSKLVERAGKIDSFIQAVKEAEHEIEEVVKRCLGDGDKGSPTEVVRTEPAPQPDNAEPRTGDARPE